MSFQANLESFERLQIWANDKDFASEGVGVDALIGRDPAESPQKWSTESSEAELCIANLVTLKGGEYFFAPSLPFLKSLEVEPFTDDHQARFGDASARVVASLDALAPVGELWPEDRMAAVKSLGIRPADFDAYYALLMPYLFDLNYSYTTEPDTGMAPTEPDVYALAQAAVPPVEVRERVRQAFLKLLDLQTLQRFSERYREDPVAALAMIGLSQQDSDQFYAYLQENYSMDFRFLAWG
jgi:hypothetical protein